MRPKDSDPIAYTITIDVDPPGLVPPGGSVGNFVYYPALLNVSAGDTVTWACKDPFSLVFKEKSPIGQLEVRGVPVSVDRQEASGASPKGNAGWAAGPFTVQDVQGNFHYAVSVWKPSSSQLFLDAACPDLSVN